MADHYPILLGMKQRWIDFTTYFARVGATIQVDSSGAELGTALNPVQVTGFPFAAVIEGGLTELIGINEQVDQNEVSDEVGVALGASYSGEILSVALYSTEDGTGAVQTPTCNLMIFDATPATTTGDTAITAAARVTQIGRVDIASTDWRSDANGASAHKTIAVPFHAVSTLYFVLRNEGASINDAAGDDEVIRFNFWYRRDS